MILEPRNPKTFKVSVVVPAFNEAENVARTSAAILEVVREFPDFELIFVDDGSTDATAQEIAKLAAGDPRIKLLSFSRNFGHQFALKAGLDHATGDCVISLDADLQHPPALMRQMVQKWLEGEEIVYTVRRDERRWTLKALTSRLFYRLLDAVTPSHVRVDAGAADFRLLDRVVVDVFKGLNERTLFLRGMVSWVGFRQFAIEYVPGEREAGESKYSVTKMARLALDGLTSFSMMPLRWSTILGLTIWVFTCLYGIFAVCEFAFTGRTITGWTSLILSILLTAGTQLLMLGVFGEYLGKMYVETKQRPLYIVRRKIW